MALTDISAISGYAGKFYQNIIKRIFSNLDIVKDVYLLRNVTAPRNLWGFNVTNGLRPLDTSVEDTNKSNGSFTARKISPEIAMRILKIIPEELRDTFLSEVLSENAKDLPSEFGAYFWNEIGQSIGAEINDNAYFGISASSVAAFNPATVYTAGQKVSYVTTEGREYFQALSTTTAGDTPISAPSKWLEINNRCLSKGFGTLIAEEIAATRLTNVVSTGAISSTNALDQIDGAMWAGVPYNVKKAGVTFLMAPATYDKRVKNLRTKKEAGSTFSDSEYEDSKKQIIDSEGKGIIKPVSWMAGSNRVIWTIDKNLVMGTNQLPGANPFGNFVQGLQHYRTIMKLITCYQIADLRYLGTNDQV